jgi:hypothetical protein
MRFIRRRCCVIKINVQTNTYDHRRLARHRRFYLAVSPSRGLVRAKQSRATDRLDRFAASGSLVELLRDNCTSRRYQEVGMTGSLTWLALVGLITILYVKKFWTRDRVLGFGTTDPLMGFGAITSHLVVPFYFTKRGFENVARTIKR